MPKFAHMSDIHIGAFRPPELRELVLSAFDLAVDKCIEAGVDFIVMAGDIFDSNIPDLSAVKRATAKMRQANEHGIRLYVVHGSHDSSPNYSSMVDVLESAGLFTKVEKVREHEGKLELSMIEDESGAKLCGISGKKLGLDRLDYELLDTRKLEAEEGFKIFVFHGALEELKSPDLAMMEAMSLSRLPRGFDYYAGGHVHGRSLNSIDGWHNIAYPGPLFAADFRDLETIASGFENGFYIVDFDAKVRDVVFVSAKTCEVLIVSYSAEGLSSTEAYDRLRSLAREQAVSGKVVLLKVYGELARGKPSDIDFGAVRRELYSKGPISVQLSYNQLMSREQNLLPQAPKSQALTERETFEERIKSVNIAEPRLQGESGVNISLALLSALKQEQRENENKSDYRARIQRAGLGIFGLKENP